MKENTSTSSQLNPLVRTLFGATESAHVHDEHFQCGGFDDNELNALVSVNEIHHTNYGAKWRIAFIVVGNHARMETQKYIGACSQPAIR
jgi:hypothetical protein